jgi:hypothetical protein
MLTKNTARQLHPNRFASVSAPAEQQPHRRREAHEFALADPDERFNLLIDILVDGLSRRAAQP